MENVFPDRSEWQQWYIHFWRATQQELRLILLYIPKRVCRTTSTTTTGSASVKKLQ